MNSAGVPYVGMNAYALTFFRVQITLNLFEPPADITDFRRNFSSQLEKNLDAITHRRN